MSDSTDSILLDTLNQFFTRLDQHNGQAPTFTALPERDDTPIQLQQHQVRATLSRVNTRKASGPDGVTGRTLKSCAKPLAEVFTTIFNLLLLRSTVPTCLKTASIIPVPKKNTMSCLNDYRPVALTPIITKCFERLISSHIKAAIPADLHPHQFAYRAKWVNGRCHHHISPHSSHTPGRE